MWGSLHTTLCVHSVAQLRVRPHLARAEAELSKAWYPTGCGDGPPRAGS